MTPEDRREYKALPRRQRAEIDRIHWTEYKRYPELFRMGIAADVRINAIGGEAAMREADEAHRMTMEGFKPKPTVRR